MERLNFETLFRVVRWDYNRCFKDESLDKDLFVEKYGWDNPIGEDSGRERKYDSQY